MHLVYIFSHIILFSESDLLDDLEFLTDRSPLRQLLSVPWHINFSIDFAPTPKQSKKTKTPRNLIPCPKFSFFVAKFVRDMATYDNDQWRISLRGTPAKSKLLIEAHKAHLVHLIWLQPLGLQAWRSWEWCIVFPTAPFRQWLVDWVYLQQEIFDSFVAIRL